MSIEQTLAFLLFSAVAAGTPGPSNVLIVATGAQVGVFRGIPCLLGVTMGTGLLLGSATLGLGALFLEHPGLLWTMKIGGALLLLRLAWQIATAPPQNEIDQREAIGFRAAALLQWVNPKSWVVSVSVAGTYFNAASADVWVQAGVLAALFVAAAVPACAIWLVSGAAISRVLRSEIRRRVFNASLGALLAGTVFFMLL